MKRQNRLTPLFALVTLVFITVFFSSCLHGNGNSKSREECLQDYQEKYKQEILNHFTENEDVFNKTAETLNAYAAGLDDIDSYKTISLGNHGIQNDNGKIAKYTLFTARQPNPDTDDRVRDYIDFLSDSTINLYDLTEDDLDKIFMGEDYNPNSQIARYSEAYCDSLSDDEHRGESIGFPFALEQYYNRADRVEATLYYSMPEVAGDNPDRINDHWYISYYVYWAPAL